MRKAYKIILMVISILLIGSIIIGTSYSMWVKTAVQKEENVLNSSCFSIEFTESSNINLTNAMPISDEAGLKKKPYTFTLKNTCNMNSKVTIALDVLSTSVPSIAPPSITNSVDLADFAILRNAAFALFDITYLHSPITFASSIFASKSHTSLKDAMVAFDLPLKIPAGCVVVPTALPKIVASSLLLIALMMS